MAISEKNGQVPHSIFGHIPKVNVALVFHTHRIILNFF